MPYINQLSGYVNERKEGGHYLVITNLTNEDFIIEPGEKLYMNRTPSETLKKYPKVPHYSKSVKIEEEPSMTSEEVDELVEEADSSILF